MAKELYESNLAREDTDPSEKKDKQELETNQEEKHKKDCLKAARGYQKNKYAWALEKAAENFEEAGEPALAKEYFEKAGYAYIREKDTDLVKSYRRKADYLLYAKKCFLKAGLPPSYTGGLNDEIKSLRGKSGEWSDASGIDPELLSGPGE